MNKKNYLLILWIIFGYVFVHAIDSILYFFINFIFQLKLKLGLSYEIMMISMPAITLIIYILTTLIVLKRIKSNSNIEGIYLTEFPKKLFFILALIAIIINPIVNKLNGILAENYSSNQVGTIGEYMAIYGWKTFGISTSRWLILIGLVFVFFRYLKKNENKT